MRRAAGAIVYLARELRETANDTTALFCLFRGDHATRTALSKWLRDDPAAVLALLERTANEHAEAHRRRARDKRRLVQMHEDDAARCAQAAQWCAARAATLRDGGTPPPCVEWPPADLPSERNVPTIYLASEGPRVPLKCDKCGGLLADVILPAESLPDDAQRIAASLSRSVWHVCTDRHDDAEK